MDKESFLSRLSEYEQIILRERIKKKEEEKKQNKESAKSIADIVKQVGQQEYVTIDNSELTINDMLVAKGYSDMLAKDYVSFKEINDLQKVTKDDVTNASGFNLTINYNGQDLGD